MPKKSKKSKSKRLSLRQKYKVIKKVKEHHRKKRKELKKSGNKPKEFKDPGIPSAWPFKEELIKEMAWKRQQILMEEKQKKEAKKRAREERSAAMDVEGDAAQLEALTASASYKQADFEARKKARLTSEGGAKAGDADNSRRAFYKEFRKVVEASDVVIQVLDARDPAGCRCPDVERYVRSLDPNKRVILLLNKMDLVPREVGEAWLKYYRQELPAVAFKASTQQQADGLSRHRSSSTRSSSKAAAAAAQQQQQQSFAAGAGCLGGETLLQLLKNYARNTAGGKGSITVGVVGLPNVGKSSLINSLKRARVAQVGSTPGVTKGMQEIHLDKHIRLLDSPGIVFASGEGAAAAALRNAIKVERLEDPIAPVSEILVRVPAKQLMSIYKVASFDRVDGFLQQVAQARGKLKRGGVVDVGAAARIVLQDWNEGRIPYYTSPPVERPNQEFESAEVVSAWASEFDADRVFAAEASAVIQHLPSLADEGAGFFEAASAGNVAVDVDGMEAEEAAAAAGDEGADSMDESDEEPTAAAAAGSSGRQAVGQNAGLYSELGQHNPKKAKADAKRAKKAAKQAAAAAADGSGSDGEDGPGSDFDFDDANAADGLVGSGSGSEGEEGSGSDGSGGDEDGGSSSDGEEYGAGGDSEDADAKYAEEMEG